MCQLRSIATLGRPTPRESSALMTSPMPSLKYSSAAVLFTVDMLRYVMILTFYPLTLTFKL